ncbi:MAG: hypothetical protein Q8L48_40020 [Archangium sp.]|nr:hypothetical protein [Archangium sp.]
MTGPYATAACQPRRSLGQSCTTFRPCLEWLECTTWRDPRSEGTCVNGFPFADAGVGEVGEDCQQPGPFRLWCAWPATCDEACRGNPVDGPGDGGQPCRCVDTTAKLGEPCALFVTQCEANGWCTDGICTASAQAGESCEMKRCAEAFTCDDGICQSPQSVCR